MIAKIVHTSEPVTLVGGAPIGNSVLSQLLDLAPHLIAADGGAAHILAAGRKPNAVIGDFDSLPDDIAAQLPPQILHSIDEQDSTDFEKCMMRIAAPLVLGAGFLGGDLGHHLAALHGLMRFASQPCVLVGGGEAVFICPPVFKLDLPAGTPVSLFPLAPVLATASGLEWSFDALAMAPGVKIGTSNRATGALHLKMSAPAALCILPDSTLPQLVTQLVAQPGWPHVRG